MWEGSPCMEALTGHCVKLLGGAWIVLEMQKMLELVDSWAICQEEFQTWNGSSSPREKCLVASKTGREEPHRPFDIRCGVTSDLEFALVHCLLTMPRFLPFIIIICILCPLRLKYLIYFFILQEVTIKRLL